MVENIIVYIGVLMILFCCHESSRECSSYYSDFIKERKYIYIKNDSLAYFLISNNTKEVGKVDYKDEKKMTLIGLLCYIILIPCEIYIPIAYFIKLFMNKNDDIVDMVFCSICGYITVLSTIATKMNKHIIN